MTKRLLTFEDLTNYFQNKYKNSRTFNFADGKEELVFQTGGTISYNANEEYDATEGMTPVRLQACHTDKNLNQSSISYQVMQQMLPSFKNRPILAYIHEVDGEPQFYGHNMHEAENGELVYDEVMVGTIPETNNATMEYDLQESHYNVFVDGYIHDAYTKAKEILEREGKCDCSVEIAVKKMSYNAKTSTLVIEEAYFSGVTILGVNEDGNKVNPGMKGSNIKIKDFSQPNNSALYNVDYQDKLVEVIEKLNNTITQLSATNLRKEDAEMHDFENTEEVIDENMSTQEPEDNEEPVVENNSEEPVMEDNACGDDDKKKCEENPEDDETEEEPVAKANSEDEPVIEENACGDDEEKKNCEAEPVLEANAEEPEEDDEEPVVENNSEEPVIEENACDDDKKKCEEEDPENTEDEPEDEDEEPEDEKKPETWSRTFELSHDDIHYALYMLLEEHDCWAWICEVYDNHFVYVDNGKYYSQAYSKNNENNTVALEGQAVEVFAEYITAEELASLNEMRNNYTTVVAELQKYKKAEELVDKQSVFACDGYAAYYEVPEFKALMSEESLLKYSKDELVEKANAIIGKLVIETKTFAQVEPEKKPAVAPFFAFAQKETKSSFIDGLLGK